MALLPWVDKLSLVGRYGALETGISPVGWWVSQSREMRLKTHPKVKE